MNSRCSLSRSMNVEAEALEDLPMPNFESFFCVSFEPQFGHVTSGLDPKTSFSKQQLHFVH